MHRYLFCFWNNGHVISSRREPQRGKIRSPCEGGSPEVSRGPGGPPRTWRCVAGVPRHVPGLAGGISRQAGQENRPELTSGKITIDDT